MMASEEKASLATRDLILAIQDQRYEEVVIPEWDNAVVRLRSLTGSERDEWEAAMMDDTNRRPGEPSRVRLQGTRARLVVRSAVDEEGNRIFSDADANALGTKNASALQRLFEVCQRLSRLTNEDVDELTKNSNGAPSADNGSTSASPSAVAP